MGQKTIDSGAWDLLALLSKFLDLGDARLDARVRRMAASCRGASSSALSEMFGADGKKGVKAAQRFLSNPNVEIAKLRSALYETTFARAQHLNVSRAVVAFDPTYLSFNDQKQKVDRFKACGDLNGYIQNNCAVVDPATGALIGVAHQTMVSRNGPDDRDFVDYTMGLASAGSRKQLESAIRQHFLVHAREVDRRAPAELELVFVADREFDDGLAFRELLKASKRSHFVVRANNQRAVELANAPWLPRNRKLPSRQHVIDKTSSAELEQAYLSTVIGSLPLGTPLREIRIDARGRVCSEATKSAHVAKLAVGSVPVRLNKRNERAMATRIAEEPIWLNLVVVRETNPRASKRPIEWQLLTDLPASTPEELALVVDSYISRWRIEEFFRTLKDAMRLERSKLDDAAATARLSVFVTLKAMFLDALRTDAGLASGEPPGDQQRKDLAAGARKAEEIEKRSSKGVTPPSLTDRQRALMLLGLIAERGHWENRRGASLGNYVLLRGLTTVLHDLAHGRYAWLVPDVG